MPLLLVQAAQEAGFPLRVEPERLQRLRAAALAHLQPRTVDAGRTLWLLLELLSVRNMAAVREVVTRTYLPTLLVAVLCLVAVAAESVAARRLPLQRSTLRLAGLLLLLVVAVERQELRGRLLRLERLALTAESIEAETAAAAVVERSRRQPMAQLVVREDSRLAAAAAEELARTRARVVLVELAAAARSTF